jgi:CheY-like chemotaxis protein
MAKRAVLPRRLRECIGSFASCSRFASSFGVPAAVGEPLDGLTILYAEDDPVTRHVTTRRLKAAGARVVEAENGLAALQKLDGTAVDLLLLDLDMPELDGVATAQRLRDDPDSSLPAFILTSNVGDARAGQARAAGVEAVFSKPLRIESLAAAIADLGTGRRAHDMQASEERGDTSPL